jgi:chaperone modulatory protein CbpM
MTMQAAEFMMHSHLDAPALEAWVEAGWLRPLGSRPEFEFSEIDAARARLIADLRSSLGVNDEAIPIVLDLIDQIHGLRFVLRELMDRGRP